MLCDPQPSFRSTSLDEGQGRLRLLCGTMSAVTVPSPITIALTDAYVTYSPSSGSSHSGRWVEGRLRLPGVAVAVPL
jgi:hypothetical protein